MREWHSELIRVLECVTNSAVLWLLLCGCVAVCYGSDTQAPTQPFPVVCVCVCVLPPECVSVCVRSVFKNVCNSGVTSRSRRGGVVLLW